MKTALMNRSSLLIGIFVIICALLAPAQGFGQGRGRGRGLDKKATKLDKKAAKFINGHDARDGRWDGRGPRARIIRGRWYDRVYNGDRASSKRGHKGRKARGIYKQKRH